MGELGFGFHVGHWSDDDARTGCTVILPPLGNVTSCDVRGSSPGSRELESLHPDRRLTEVHAVLLTGGSAFGLAAADGVMKWLAERDVGYQTKVATVPIVPAAVIFDLGSGSSDVRPGAAEGRAACEAASEESAVGAVGAGTGATVGKWAGLDFLAPGGLGLGRATSGAWTVSALAVVNSVGDVVGDDGSVVAGTSNPSPEYLPPAPPDAQIAANTVLAVVATDAALDKRDVHWLAGRGSDGITVSVRPAHTRYDGDVVFAVATGASETSGTDLDVLGYLATRAVAAAVRNAVS
jgi:L-aminopeptidase/D-esterase-like protein